MRQEEVKCSKDARVAVKARYSGTGWVPKRLFLLNSQKSTCFPFIFLNVLQDHWKPIYQTQIFFPPLVLVVFNIIGEENGLESQEYLSSPWLREHVTDLSCVT